MRPKIVKLNGGVDAAAAQFDEQRKQPLYCHV
jgi:hypothetical protein